MEIAVRRRLFICLLCLGPALIGVVPFAATAASAAPPASVWANGPIRTVTAAGLMGGGSVATFRPTDPLTAQALEDVVFALEQRLVPVPPVTTQPVTTQPVPPVTTPTDTTA